MSDDNTSDNGSLASKSVSNSSLECPECKKELTFKYMFNHIRLNHPGYFHKITVKEWQESAPKNSPLKILWEVKNDFDETDDIVVYGCLATNKTFKSVARATAHFKKNPSALKDHNKQLKDMMAARKRVLELERKKKEKERKKDPEKASMRDLLEANDPVLRAKYDSLVRNTLLICERLVDDTKPYLDRTTECPDFPAMRVQTIQETHNLFRTCKNEYERGTLTAKGLRSLNATLDRVLFLRTFGIHHCFGCCNYAFPKDGDNPDGLYVHGIDDILDPHPQN